MKSIFGYLKKSKLAVFVIVLLLIVQAYCDLELPNYTADIVDVGISKEGIKEIIPEKIRQKSLDGLVMFVPEDKQQTVLNAYEKTGKKSEDEDEILNLKAKGSEYREVEELLTKPVMLNGLIISALGQGTTTSDNALGMDMEKMEKLKQALYGEDSTNETRVAALDEVYDMFGSLAENMVSQLNCKYISQEYEACGIDMGDFQTKYLIKSGIKMLLVSMLGMIVAIFVGMIAAQTAAKTAMNLRNQVFRKVLAFSNVEMDKFSTASLITRSTNDIQQIQMVIVMLLRMVMFAPVMAIGGIIKVLSTNASLSWIIVVAVITILCIVMVLMVIAMPKFKIMQSLVDRVNLVAREILTGLPVIRAFSREKYEEERFDEANKVLKKTQLFVNRVMAFMQPAMMLIMNCITLAILWFGAKGIDKGTMQVGEMTAFITYTMLIVMSFLMLTMISIMMPRAAVSATRVDEILNTELTVVDREGITENKEAGNGVVEFKDVSFKYPNADDDVLKNITFTAKPGQTTAIIGSTGSGKTTLVNLIPRFYDVTEGYITIDGIDIRDMSQEDLRNKLGFVPQKGVLFSGDIASNLRFGKEDATDEEIKRAAAIAQAEEFISQKEEGYKSPISQGGTNVSGGQKQRLSIARAIAKNPKVYVFDDSFSALDYKTDVALRKALKEEIKDSTVIIVAQRISTILNAEQIIVLDDGEIAGIGTHRELLKNCDVYKQIAQSQLSEAEINASLAGNGGQHE